MAAMAAATLKVVVTELLALHTLSFISYPVAHFMHSVLLALHSAQEAAVLYVLPIGQHTFKLHLVQPPFLLSMYPALHVRHLDVSALDSHS